MLKEEYFSRKYGKKVVVVYVSEEDANEESQALLSEYECDLLAGFRIEKRKKEFLLSRIAVKKAISSFTGKISPEEISVRNNVFGCPYIEGETDERYHVSISHTSKIACCIVSDMSFPCGIDIEEVNERHRKSFLEILSENEKSYLENNEDIFKAAVFWTAHEAVSKILMTGLTVDHKLYEVDKMFFDMDNDRFMGNFKKLMQYEFFGKIIRNKKLAVTVAYPRKSDMNIVSSECSGVFNM